jgi:hypothetical protein
LTVILQFININVYPDSLVNAFAHGSHSIPFLVIPDPFFHYGMLFLRDSPRHASAVAARAAHW